jgi:hypothetical protein
LYIHNPVDVKTKNGEVRNGEIVRKLLTDKLAIQKQPIEKPAEAGFSRAVGRAGNSWVGMNADGARW